MPKKSGPGLFDYVKALSESKSSELRPMDDPNYSQYLVNSAFAHYRDTVIQANTMNTAKSISDRQHFDFYMGSVKKGRRWSKWIRSAASRDEMIAAVASYMKIPYSQAEREHELIPEEQLGKIHRIVTGK